MADTHFTNQVTKFPADWANDVNDLVYDVFGAAKTAVAARTALGLGSVALQNVNAVNLEGGIINGVSIGATVPAAGHFNLLRTTQATPAHAQDAIPYAWFQSRWALLDEVLSFDPTAVNLTGGNVSGVVIEDSSLDGTPIGANNPSTAVFTTLSLQNALGVVNGGTGSIAYTGRYLIYVQTPTPHFEAINEIPIADINGVGTMAEQNANNVDITGGSLDGVTLGVGTVYEGLGGMAEQEPNAVNITGGTLQNVTLIGVTTQLGIQTIVEATTLDHTKDVILIDGTGTSFIVDLPNPGLVTRPLFIKKSGEERIDLRAPASVAVEGLSMYNLFADGEAIILISDGDNYHVF